MICGRVIIEDYVYVGPYAVIRADEVNDAGEMDPIIIKSHSNIQDGVVIHSKSGAAVTIGSGSSIAHRAIVHGPCRVDDRVFIGFNSVLFNCHIQSGCVIRYNAVVDGVTLPENSYVPSTERVCAESVLDELKKWIRPLCNSPKRWQPPTLSWWRVISDYVTSFDLPRAIRLTCCF